MTNNPYDDPAAFAHYLSIRGRDNNYNDNVEIPIFKAILPELAGKSVLDLGCGYGEMSKWYATEGALSVYGIDISEKMIARARAFYSHPAVSFDAMGMDAYDFPKENFDLVASSLAMQYIEDFDRLVRGISRSLRPGGHLVFSQEHPVVTCIDNDDIWLRDSEGKKIALKVRDYSDEGARTTSWLGLDMQIYHRRLETVITTLLKYDLQIEALRESEASHETIQKYPKLADTRMMPSFLFIRCRKGN